MRASGVVVEYNPFHNGHLYHLNETKKMTKSDLVIAVMSGNFLQRGEPALVSKWARTKMALEAGVDLVIELPYAYSAQKAETFAFGAIALLEELKCTAVCFGSEDGNIESFIRTVTFMEGNLAQYNHQIKTALKQGASYPKAASIAFKEISGSEPVLDLAKPNNILGFHYVKAIMDNQFSIQPQTVERTGAGYHDEDLPNSSIASATSIRKTLFSNKLQMDEITPYMPGSSARHLVAYWQKYKAFHSWEGYFPLLKYRLLSSSPQELSDIYEAEEGLENRLIAAISDAASFKEFMERVKTKRYTWTRLQRLCLHILTGTTKLQMSAAHNGGKPSYIRLLGMNKIGQKYLQGIKKDLSLPLVSKLSSHDDSMLQLDRKAANIYSMLLPEPERSLFIKEEYSTPPIRIDDDKVQYA